MLTSRTRYRTAFISDVHLGFKGCNAGLLLEFLHRSEFDSLYLVGDLIDVVSLKNRPYWPERHNEVLQLLLQKARQGTRVIFIPGNHDEIFRVYDGQRFGNVEIRREAIHVTATGRRLLVLHGDEFQSSTPCPAWLAVLGNAVYSGLLEFSRFLSLIRERLGLPYWSLAACLKHKVAPSMHYIQSFERIATAEAARRGLDGVICGHIHSPCIAQPSATIAYHNDGDWVESCTALVEDFAGQLSLLRCSEFTHREALSAAVPQPFAIDPAA
jgi:UDP-2,3-diacylglucosamine pyrophosphatase LpxH